jgi:hypothetical protein
MALPVGGPSQASVSVRPVESFASGRYRELDLAARGCVGISTVEISGFPGDGDGGKATELFGGII